MYKETMILVAIWIMIVLSRFYSAGGGTIVLAEVCILQDLLVVPVPHCDHSCVTSLQRSGKRSHSKFSSVLYSLCNKKLLFILCDLDLLIFDRRCTASA